MNFDHLLGVMHNTRGQADHERVRALLDCIVDKSGGEDVSADDLRDYIFGARREAHEFDRRVQISGDVALVELDERGKDGEIYELGDEPETVLGREGDLAFQDEFLSPRHALLSWRDGRLFVRDLDSINGSFIRVNDHIELAHQDVFLAGRQVLQFLVEVEPVKESDGTRLMGSPAPERPRARVAQLGSQGEIYRMQDLGDLGIEVGRNLANVEAGYESFEFAGDNFQSERHLRIVRRKGRWVLEDMNSSNGTWIRIDGERELHHGDFLFVGALLFRVVIAAEAS